jgi:hypothetical protein
MIAWLTVLLLMCSGIVLACIPRPLLTSYRQTFAMRHGVSVQIGITILAITLLSVLIETLVRPDPRPVMEFVDAVVAVLVVVAGWCDLYLYSKLAEARRE